MIKNPPKEIKIYYSRWFNFLLVVSSGVAMINMLHEWYAGRFSIGGLFFFLFLGIFFSFYLKRFLNKTPQLILNKKGIKVIDEKIIVWSHIAHTKITSELSGRNRHQYLEVYVKRNKKPILITKIDFTHLGISKKKLENAVIRYRRAHRLMKGRK